jgi:uncharacterized ferredoxin-like protein
MTNETKAVRIVAELMALSARTAPKARGIDSIEIRVITGADLNSLTKEMRRIGEAHNLKFFSRDAENMEQSDACVLVGSEGESVVGLDCGGCGYLTCQKMLEAQNNSAKDKPFSGPNCVIRMADLGIALGSAAKTACLHNVDNRIMFSAGVSALSLGWLDGCKVAYGLPLNASGKNIYFDRSS